MLLYFIPIVNLFWWIVMGKKGNEWAWRKNHWASVEHFEESQKKWKPWGIVFFVFLMLSAFQQLMMLIRVISALVFFH